MYRLSLLLFVIVCTVSGVYAEPPLAEDPDAVKRIGYTTVAEALEALKAEPSVNVSVSKPDGWTIVNDSSKQTIWSFTPEGHYAYPAVVRRVVKQRDNGDVYIEMDALCQAAKDPCDQLIREFEELNEKIRKQMLAGKPPQ